MSGLDRIGKKMDQSTNSIFNSGRDRCENKSSPLIPAPDQEVYLPDDLAYCGQCKKFYIVDSRFKQIDYKRSMIFFRCPNHKKFTIWTESIDLAEPESADYKP